MTLARATAPNEHGSIKYNKVKLNINDAIPYFIKKEKEREIKNSYCESSQKMAHRRVGFGVG